MTRAAVYLDYNATTPVDPTVLEAMLPWFGDRFWNAASAHPLGRAAAAAVESARGQVGSLVAGRPGEIVWTSGATEANNLALKGAVESADPSRRRVLVGATEHKAVLDVGAWLETRGYVVEHIPVDDLGVICPAALGATIGDDVAIVSVMLANNETGVVAPVRELADLAHEHGALFHTDATQAVGRVPVDFSTLGADLASFSSHKLYGPKGIGGLFVTRRTPLSALIHGGGHERGLRSGTLNVPAIVGFGVAAEVANRSLHHDQGRGRGLICRLTAGFRSTLSEMTELAADAARLPNTVNLRFHGADAEAVMANAPGVAISSGSACTALIPAASHVLRAMGLSETEAMECLRFSVGRPTTEDEVDLAITEVAAAVARVRELSC